MFLPSLRVTFLAPLHLLTTRERQEDFMGWMLSRFIRFSSNLGHPRLPKLTFPVLPPSFLHATLDLYFPVNYFEFSTFLLINKWGYSSPFFLFAKPWMLLSIYLITKNMT